MPVKNDLEIWGYVILTAIFFFGGAFGAHLLFS